MASVVTTSPMITRSNGIDTYIYASPCMLMLRARAALAVAVAAAHLTKDTHDRLASRGPGSRETTVVPVPRTHPRPNRRKRMIAARREGPPVQGQPEARGPARLEDRRRRRRQGAGGEGRRGDDRQPHHRQRLGGDRRDQPPCRSSRRATWRSGIRARMAPRCSACASGKRVSPGMGGLGERHRGARARHARHLSRRRLLASRRQHPADPRGGADHGASPAAT